MYQPPKWADRFLEWYCDPLVLEDLQGDLHELYKRKYEDRGKLKANASFIWLVIRSFRLANLKSPSHQKNTFGMYKNYFKIAIRSLSRSTLYSTINISGLAVGMAVFMLIFLYVKDELSYDDYHSKGDNIYRVVSDLTVPDNFFQFALTPPHLGTRLKEDFPEVQDYVRLSSLRGIVKLEEKTFNDEVGLYADPSFFNFFDIPLIEGDEQKALSDPFTIILSESTAKKYFGDEDPIGKLLELDGVEQRFSIVGIIEDVPHNTHFYFDYLVSFTTRESLGIIQGDQWFYLDYYTYVMFPDGFNTEELQAKLPDFIEKHIGDDQREAGQTYEFHFQPLRDIYLKSHRDVEIGANGNLQYIYIFSLIAVFIVVIACVNFMNLSTARSSKRAKEIGLRKVVGAVKRQLVAQFLLESIIITVFAFILSLALTSLALPSFNLIVSKELITSDLFKNAMPLFWALLVGATGFLAGIYPALVLSGFKPINALRASVITGRENTALRKSLVVFQLIISTILIMGTIVISQQLTSMQNRNLGFDKEQMLMVYYASDQMVRNKMEELREELNKNPNVSKVSFSRYTPSTGASNWYTTYELGNGETQNASMYGYLVDFDFINAYGLEMVAGRAFDRSMGTDLDEAFIVNETAALKMGTERLADILGKDISQFGKEGKVIGVVKDFNFKTLHSEIEPLVIQLGTPGNFAMVSIKLKAGVQLQTLESIEDSWKNVITTVPFDAYFLDQELNDRYEAEIRTGKIFGIFSGLAIFIAALGLFALSTLSAEQQRKNISVRKVLGASETGIVYGFANKFLKLAFIAFLVSVPATFLLAESWLENFTYRINVNLSMFLLGGVIILLITLLTISFQSFRLTRLNPAQNLRSE